MLMRNSLLWLAGNNTLRRQITQSKLSRPVARRFVAGETAEQAFAAVAQLNSQGALVTLDYLGENVTSVEEATAVRQTYIGLLEEIGRRGLKCNVSLKLTALGLDINRAVCEANLRTILDTGQAHDNFVRLDMEGSDYTQITLDIFEQMFVAEGRKNVGVVIQSYLYRSAADIERLNQLQARVRLCKGAYNEPATVAYPQKSDVDKNYIELTRRLLTAGNYPGLATHDSTIVDWVKRFVREHQIGTERYEFQMLYGVRRDLQQQLIKDGYTVRVYVPFGEAWYPYLMRRMAERPANLLFILKALRHR
jgi:proline dehydrogenase